jgi:3-dehydroquinate synthase
MALDTLYSSAVGLLPPAAAERALALLARLGLPRWDEALDLRDPSGRPAVLDGLAEFREHLGGELTVTLLAGIGRAVEVHEMPEGLVRRVLDDLRRRSRRP